MRYASDISRYTDIVILEFILFILLFLALAYKEKLISTICYVFLAISAGVARNTRQDISDMFRN